MMCSTFDHLHNLVSSFLSEISSSFDHALKLRESANWQTLSQGAHSFDRIKFSDNSRFSSIISQKIQHGFSYQ